MRVTICIESGRPRLTIEPENVLERSVIAAMGPEHGQGRELAMSCDGERLVIAASSSPGGGFSDAPVLHRMVRGDQG